MPDDNIKEAYRIFWMIKGHLGASEETILSCADGYFKRLWCNNEAYLHEEGFEEAWNKLKQ
jgi:hypothetical protein